MPTQEVDGICSGTKRASKREAPASRAPAKAVRRARGDPHNGAHAPRSLVSAGRTPGTQQGRLPRAQSGAASDTTLFNSTAARDAPTYSVTAQAASARAARLARPGGLTQRERGQSREVGVYLHRKAEVARDQANNIALDSSRASVGPSPMYISSNGVVKGWLQLYANALLLT